MPFFFRFFFPSCRRYVEAKGWLSGTLKTWADKLDGSGGKQQPQPSTGFHAYQMDSNGNVQQHHQQQQQQQRWDTAQNGLFNASGGGGGGGGGGVGGGFYDDVSDDEDDDRKGGGGGGGGSDSESEEEYPLAKGGGGGGGGSFVPGMNTGHAQGRPSDRADVFANSIKSLASDFGGQANIEDNFYNDD